jgi:hypothetical protein
MAEARHVYGTPWAGESKSDVARWAEAPLAAGYRSWCIERSVYAASHA